MRWLHKIFRFLVILLLPQVWLSAGWDPSTVIHAFDGLIPLAQIDDTTSILTCTNLALLPAQVVTTQAYQEVPYCLSTIADKFIVHPEQLVYSLDRSSWVKVQDLALYEHLATGHGYTMVMGIQGDLRSQLLCRVCVSPYESYLVGTEGIWAHNEALVITAATASLAGPAAPIIITGAITIGLGCWISSLICEAAYQNAVLALVKKGEQPPLMCLCRCHMWPIGYGDYTCEGCRANVKLHPHGWFNAAPYHRGNKGNRKSDKSEGPSNAVGQTLLDVMSFPHPTKIDHRISFDPVRMQILIFSPTAFRIWHGHYEEWAEFEDQLIKPIKKLFGLNAKGKPV